MLLAAVGIMTILVWENRAGIAEAVLQDWVQPRLHLDRFQKIGSRLLADTHADLVVLAEVSVRTNLLKNIDGIRRADPAWSPALNPRPLFGSIRDPLRFVAFLEGRAVCHDLDPNNGEEERAEAALGIRRRCYLAVPPVLDALVGILAIGWSQPLAAETEEGATKLLYTAATQLASW